MGFFRKAFKFVRRIFRGRRKAKRIMPKRRKTLKRLVNRPFTIKKTVLLDRILVSGITTQVLTAELSDIPQFATYTQLYDQYKINKVTVRYRVLNNVNTNTSAFPSGINTLGMVHSVVDYTDQTPPASVQLLMNDSSYYGTKSNRDHVRTFRPKFLDVIAGAVQARSVKATWLHTDSPGISHYGLKTIFEAGIVPAGFTNFVVEPIVTYYISFKDQKN